MEDYLDSGRSGDCDGFGTFTIRDLAREIGSAEREGVGLFESHLWAICVNTKARDKRIRNSSRPNVFEKDKRRFQPTVELI